MNQVSHPFSGPLTELTADELDKKHGELMSRLHIARRMNMGENVLYQIDILLSNIEEERYNRMTLDEKADGVILETDPTPVPPTPIPRKRKQ